MPLRERIAFAAGLLERAAHLREKPRELEALRRQGACILPFWHAKPLLRSASGSRRERLAFLAEGHPLLAHAPEAPLFLGLRPDRRPVFAADVTAWQPPDGEAPGKTRPFVDQARQPLAGVSNGSDDDNASSAFADLRAVMAALAPVEAEIAATGRALLSWHRSHRFCAACGAESRPAQAGWQRTCRACGSAHFPRTDPVVIMLVTNGDSVLLGRSPGWPERMYSLLAGFMEPGESIEAAVRREVAEETGVAVAQVRYLASQPWPFPASLMIGCQARATSTDIRLDENELEDALWIGNGELAQVLDGTHPRITAPRPGTIARYLLEKRLAKRRE